MDHPLLMLLIGSTAPPKPLPPNASWSLRYELWLRDHHKWLLPLLDTARSLSLFLPGRFQEGGQLRAEGIYTFLNVLSVYHDKLLDNPRALTAEIKLDPQGSQHAVLKLAQGVLLFLYYSEVFIEMAARKAFPAASGNLSEQTRGSWLVISAVEAIKAMCRLMMLAANRGRMLLPPSQEDMILDHMASIRAKQKTEILERERHEYEQNRKALPPGDIETGATSAPASDAVIPRSASSLPPNSSFSPFPLQSGHLAPLHIQNLLDLYVRHGRQTSTDSKLGRPHGRFVSQTVHEHDSPSYTPPVQHILSEILHFVRPVVYTLARAGFVHDPNSWTPFFLSVAVDGFSRALAPRMASLSREEFAELSGRISRYLFYLLRDPMFSRFVSSPLQSLSELLARIPLLGAFLSSIINLIFSIQKYYFYTSAS